MNEMEKQELEKQHFKRQICFPIFLCAKELIGRYNEALKEFNLTYTQFVVMSYFWHVGKSDLKDISSTIMLDASTLTPLLQKLEAKGLIYKKQDEKDKRKLEITLTPKGKALQAATADVPDRVTSQIHINPDEGILLHDLAKKLIDELRKE